MTSYQSRNQITAQVKALLPEQIKECKECDELPSSLQRLIMHNFQATFVCYDKKTNSIEVGVEEEEIADSYPKIKVLKISLDKAASHVAKTLRSGDQDLKFYGKLLSAHNSVNKVDEVVLV